MTNFTQDDLKKINLVKGMLESRSFDIMDVEIVGDDAIFKSYISADQMPYKSISVARRTIVNMDWAMLVLLIENSPQSQQDNRRKRFTLVVTFDGDESDDCLEKVQQSIAYLRQRGWNVEEKDS